MTVSVLINNPNLDLNTLDIVYKLNSKTRYCYEFYITRFIARSHIFSELIHLSNFKKQLIKLSNNSYFLCHQELDVKRRVAISSEWKTISETAVGIVANMWFFNLHNHTLRNSQDPFILELQSLLDSFARSHPECDLINTIWEQHVLANANRLL